MTYKELHAPLLVAKQWAILSLFLSSSQEVPVHGVDRLTDRRWCLELI